MRIRGGVRQEGLADERGLEPVSLCRRASGQHPSQRGSPTAWSSSMPFTCIWAEPHARGGVDDTRYGQGRNGVAINLEAAGLMSYEYVRSALVFPALCVDWHSPLRHPIDLCLAHTCLFLLSLACLTDWLLKMWCNFRLCVTSSLLVIHPSCFSCFLYSRSEFPYVILFFFFFRILTSL